MSAHTMNRSNADLLWLDPLLEKTLTIGQVTDNIGFNDTSLTADLP